MFEAIGKKYNLIGHFLIFNNLDSHANNLSTRICNNGPLKYSKQNVIFIYLFIWEPHERIFLRRHSHLTHLSFYISTNVARIRTIYVRDFFFFFRCSRLCGPLQFVHIPINKNSIEKLLGVFCSREIAHLYPEQIFCCRNTPSKKVLRPISQTFRAQSISVITRFCLMQGRSQNKKVQVKYFQI